MKVCHWFQDDEVVAFPDIRPAAKYHFLISPREHIKDAKILNPTQISLVDRLVEVGTKIVNEKIQADHAAEGKEVNVNEIPKLMGFHWPPFHSIAHLHLHVIAPADSMGFISRTIFRPNSWWFVTVRIIIVNSWLLSYVNMRERYSLRLLYLIYSPAWICEGTSE